MPPMSAQMATESRPPMPMYSLLAEHPGWAMLNFDRSRLIGVSVLCGGIPVSGQLSLGLVSLNGVVVAPGRTGPGELPSNAGGEGRL